MMYLGYNVSGGGRLCLNEPCHHNRGCLFCVCFCDCLWSYFVLLKPLREYQVNWLNSFYLCPSSTRGDISKIVQESGIVQYLLACATHFASRAVAEAFGKRIKPYNDLREPADEHVSAVFSPYKLDSIHRSRRDARLGQPEREIRPRVLCQLQRAPPPPVPHAPR